MIVIVSFFLENIFSNFFSYRSIFFPLFTLVSIGMAVYHYKEETVFKMAFIIGLLYDITYTNTLGFHMLLFYLMSMVALFLKSRLKNNLLNFILIGILLIFCYLISSYFILLLLGYLEFNSFILLNSLKNCFFINILYLFLLYGINKIIHRKQK